MSVRIDAKAMNRTGLRIAKRKVLGTTMRVLNRGTVLTPVRTGNLRSQNKQRQQTRGLRVVGEVFNNTKYAAAVHNGQPARTIRPRTKKALRFVVGGRVVYAKQVRHPGTRGRPWLARALREVAGGEGYRVSTQ